MSYYTVSVNQPGVTVSYAPAPTQTTVAFSYSAPASPPTVPIAAPIAGVEYYVYRCSPTAEHPMPHWKYYPATMSKQELPDIREARPLYTWSSVTGQYSPVNNIQVKY
jgi:hypothetical protein